jgi:hypothetical protein
MLTASVLEGEALGMNVGARDASLADVSLQDVHHGWWSTEEDLPPVDVRNQLPQVGGREQMLPLGIGVIPHDRVEIKASPRCISPSTIVRADEKTLGKA